MTTPASVLSKPTPVRRGACPSLAAPMPTGDGLLLRFRPPIEGWPPSAVAALAEAARRFGNGVLEVTARGSLQARGFTAATVPSFAAVVAKAGVTDGPPVVAVNPLAGQDPRELADPRPVARAIAADLPALAPKVSVLVDGGGPLHLGALDADIRLRAVSGGNWHLWAGATYLGVVAPAAAAQAVLFLLRQLAAEAPDARMRDRMRARHSLTLPDDWVRASLPPAPMPDARPIGIHPLRTGVALGIAGPFGAVAASSLERFARLATEAQALRPAPGRALLAVGVSAAAAARLRSVAADLGFVTAAGDPRRRIVACAGAPSCAAAECATRPLAARLAQQPDALPDGIVHLSGCFKGCAHPTDAAVTLVGQAGRFGLVRRGTARSAPIAVLPPGDIPSVLACLT